MGPPTLTSKPVSFLEASRSLSVVCGLLRVLQTLSGGARGQHHEGVVCSLRDVCSDVRKQGTAAPQSQRSRGTAWPHTSAGTENEAPERAGTAPVTRSRPSKARLLPQAGERRFPHGEARCVRSPTAALCASATVTRDTGARSPWWLRHGPGRQVPAAREASPSLQEPLTVLVANEKM